MVYMCPDRQILSVYFDGELPSPWKEKMEAHLAHCPGCRKTLEAYRRIAAMARLGEDEEVLEGAKERLWRKLGLPEIRDQGSSSGESGGRSFPHPPGRGFVSPWKRRISLPLPAAAAAVLFLFAALFAFLALPRSLPFRNPDALISAENDEDAIVPVSDMNGILQYLRNQERGDIMIIRLPESKSFSSSGEPTIIRASDYLRRIPPR
jgi:hypothetical protein